MSSPEEASAAGFVDGCIARMLERAGLQPRQRVTYVAQTLQLGYQLARRRMIGETPWTVDELARLANSCGETLTSLFADDAAPGLVRTGQAAEFVLGPVRIPCRVWIGDKATSRKVSPLVAVQPTKDQWLVVPTPDAPEAESFEVERVLIQLGNAKKQRVAVLDDNEDIAKSIVEYMNGTGIEAQAFFSLDELMAEVEAKPFDGYVIDWLIDQRNARSLIAAIRAKDQSCPIVLLTGQLVNGNADESELASIASYYRLTFFEKPVRTSSLLSALQLGFGVPAVD
ncbi:MAG: helix-turn-helix domain-containing protein [Gaiellaceae bacterium]